MSTSVVGIVMGAKMDLPVMEQASTQLQELGVAHTLDVVSVHHNPAKVSAWAAGAADAGYKVLIAGASRGAHLPGLIAAYTSLPVIGVPCMSDRFSGADALYSIAQMPTGTPVATVGIDGAKNAAVLAVQILALSDPELAERLQSFREEQADKDVEHRDIPAGDDSRPSFGFGPS